MIKGLIYTDNLDYWVNEFYEALKDAKVAKKEKCYIVYNQYFYITITSYFNESQRGYCFNFSVLDKEPTDFDEQLIRACTKASVISQYKIIKPKENLSRYNKDLDYIENILKIHLFDYQKRILKGILDGKKILVARGAGYSYTIDALLKAEKELFGSPWTIDTHRENFKYWLEHYRPTIEEADIIVPYWEVIEETNVFYPEGFFKRIRESSPEKFEQEFNFKGARK